MVSELKSLLKTTSKYASFLEDNGITTPRDLLQYFPRTYEDRSNIKMLRELTQDALFFQQEKKETVMVKGKIVKKSIFIRGGKKIYDIRFVDEEWTTWYISIFNSWFLAAKIQEDKRYLIIGKPNFKFKKLIFSHPDVVETQGNDDAEDSWEFTSGRIYPIYSELQWIKPSWFANKIWQILPLVPQYFKEYLPKEFLKDFDLMDVETTIKEMHFPTTLEMNLKAKYRVFFDRLLRIQLYSLLNKQVYQAAFTAGQLSLPTWDVIKTMVEKLPFELTWAQKKVTKHVIENLHDQKPMLRLLQWDVWSWKTIVAALAAYYTHVIFKGQSIFLAPLEVLANQHYRTLSKLLLPLWLRTELLTGSLTKWQKDKIKSDIKQGKIHVVIGTHAVLQEDVAFADLKFVVIDEQHKFWVRQRGFFKKFWAPHILQMSATPIPRSMALAFFWEFDVSIIDEMPAWRLPIYTKIISEKEYHKLKPWILDRIAKWQKVFVVTPLIEESEKLEEVKAATVLYEEICSLYPELKGKIWLLHGKMKAQDKEQIMQSFKSWSICLLVSTTVIEVWVDVPEATIMIIKNAERFWLSQLHQLRWRIWRSDIQSYCFLETKNKSGDSYTRLKAMEETTDWFKLAELDLQHRWPWEILWTHQSWETDIPLEILSDLKFLEKVQAWAKWLLEKYPNLEWLWTLKEQLQDRVWDVLV